MKFLSNVYTDAKHVFSSREMHMDKLAGNFIVASPAADEKDYFSKALIFIISHDNTGTIGVVLNRSINNFTSHLVFKSLNITYDQSKNYDLVYSGGPVDAERGIVLHSSDYFKNSTKIAGSDVAISSNIDILKDIASSKGPKFAKLFLGYTGWAKGQLEEEILSGCWYALPYSKELFFSSDDYSGYDIALSKLGINKAFLAPGNDRIN